MSLIIGIDPGITGAIALYETNSMRIVGMYDMPFWYQTVGKKKRKRIDHVGLMELFQTLNLLGADLAVMEAVGGRPRQSASGGFVFGYSVGLIYSELMHSRIMIETVKPQVWKKILRVPGKTKGTDDDIIQRADEFFPHDRHLYRGVKGGKKIDRAEAAMLAKFGGDHVLPTLGPITDDNEWFVAYQQADTGA